MNVSTFIFKYLLYSQFLVTPPLPTASFKGQTVIVTGSNTGIGYEAVKHLIRLDASKIILAVRSLARGQAAVEKLVAETKCDPDRLEVWVFDLGSFASIREFVARANTLDRLDAVIQNAGVAPLEGKIDGVEILAHVNLIAPLYFAYAILPKLRESAKKTGLTGRLSLNGSDTMYVAKLGAINSASGSLLETMSNPELQKGPFATGFPRYELTKTLLFYAVHALAAQSPLSESSPVLINTITPGLTISDFGEDRENPLSAPVKWLKSFIMSLAARRTDVGARTLIHGAEPDLDKKAHGAFLMDSQIVVDNPVLGSKDAEEIEKRIHKDIIDFLEKIQPGVTSI